MSEKSVRKPEQPLWFSYSLWILAIIAWIYFVSPLKSFGINRVELIVLIKFIIATVAIYWFTKYQWLPSTADYRQRLREIEKNQEICEKFFNLTRFNVSPERILDPNLKIYGLNDNGLYGLLYEDIYEPTGYKSYRQRPYLWLIEFTYQDIDSTKKNCQYQFGGQNEPSWRISDYGSYLKISDSDESIPVDMTTSTNRLTVMQFITRYDSVAEARATYEKEYTQKIIESSDINDTQKINYLKKLYNNSCDLFEDGIKPDMEKFFLD